MITREFARSLIKRPSGTHNFIKLNYDTMDIVKAVLDADKDSDNDTEKFAKALRFRNLEDLCRQIFDFLLYQITYKEDERGTQVIKKPSALFYYGKGDCKSYSVFAGSVFKNLGIPYTYRFVSFKDPGIYTHVYPVAHGQSKSIIVDAVLKRFNQEKPYKFKKDYNMKGLAIIGNAGVKSPTMLNFKKDVDQLSEADLELEIIRQRAEIEKEIIARQRGINSTKVAEYQQFIDGLHGVIAAVDRDDMPYLNGIISGMPNGVGKTIFGKILKKVATPIKKVTKAVTKVVTAPARLMTKAALELTLPKAAPMFLYLFVNDRNLIAKMPEKARKKRERQTKLADFIVNGIGMKRPHFMGILRNGIMKRYGMSPEKKISQLMKIKESEVKGYSSIGDIGIIDDIIKAVVSLIANIVKLFKKKKVDVNPEDAMPSDSDFANMTEAQKEALSRDVKQQPDAVEPGDTLDNTIPDDGGRKFGGGGGICG